MREVKEIRKKREGKKGWNGCLKTRIPRASFCVRGAGRGRGGENSLQSWSQPEVISLEVLEDGIPGCVSALLPSDPSAAV